MEKPAPALGRYWLWLGPVVDEAAMLSGAAVSTAASKWQRGIIGGLRAEGAEVEVVSYLPEPAWPRGAIFVDGESIGMSKPGRTSISYLNLPFLRESHLAQQHLRVVDAMVRERGAPEAVIGYNAILAYSTVGRYCMRLGSRWITVVADIPDEDRALTRFHRLSSGSWGFVYLSWDAFNANLAVRRCLHLDGGVDEIRVEAGRIGCELSPGAILYSGALSKYGGLDLLLEAFRLIPRVDVELWVCGKGTSPLLRDRARADPRIKYFGVVPEAVLGELSLKASVFANPRPVNLVGSKNNFPSKVMEYLRYGKPIVSTWTPGLAPEFGSVLITADDEPTAFAMRLVSAIEMSSQDLADLRARSSAFLQSRLWTLQAERMLHWAREDVVAK